MLCDNCKSPLKPIVALDIDGTMADYHTSFINFCRTYLDTHISMDYYGDVSLAEHIGISKREYREIKLAYRVGGMKRSMPITTINWRSLVNRVRDLGAEVWITTTRPYLRLDNVDPDTREWLRRNFIEYDHLLYDEHKYQRLTELVSRERIVGIVDDLGEMYDEATALDLPIIQMRTKFNIKDRRENGSDNVNDITNELLKRIREWKELHG